MRLAVIADIHGNLQALEAVLADVRRWSPDLLLVGGDIVLHGPDSLQVLKLLSTIDHIAIRGNAEERVLQTPEEESADEHPVVRLSRFIKEQLGSHWLGYISSLPDHRYFSVRGNNDVCLSHGVPGDPFRGVVWSDERERYLLSDPEWPKRFVPPDELKKILRNIPANLFITAHIHRQFQRYVEGVTIVNPGPATGEHIFCSGQIMAEYMICDLSPKLGAWSFIFRQVPFDAETTLSRLEALKRDCDAVEWEIRSGPLSFLSRYRQ